MAQRRMFSLQIVDTDAFLDMPPSSQLLYFHLAMRADDDGFVSSPKKIMKMCGGQDMDYKILLAKRFLIYFESGVCVIKHWKIHNYIQNDRYNETKYLDEKKQLIIKDNGSYTECIQDVYSLDTQVRLGKDSIKGEKISPQSEPLKDNNEENMSWNKQPDDEPEVFIDADSGEEIKPAQKVKRNYKPVYSLFEEVLGKKPNNWLVNTTQQKCAENLFTERGIPAIKNALYWYQDHKEEEFCPQISSPSDLDSKWTKLAEFKRKYGS